MEIPTLQLPKLVFGVEMGGYSRERWTTWKKEEMRFQRSMAKLEKSQSLLEASLTCCLDQATIEVVDNLPFGSEEA